MKAKVEITGYIPAYKQGVIACLKRNYEWMGRASDEAVYEWARPMFEYKWQTPLPDRVKPYQHGLVLISGGEVVGYLGFIFSLRRYRGRDYVYQTGTTWAVDEKYRLYIFKALKLAYSLADVMGDFTPRKSVEEILSKVFKFGYADQWKYRFYPVPCLRSCLDCQVVTTSSQIEDESIKTVFNDHRSYRLKCIRFQQEQKGCYIFYQVRNRVKKGKLFTKKSNLANLVGISDRDFFHRHYKEIIWKMQKLERAYVEVDESFLPQGWSHLWFRKSKVSYLEKNSKKTGIPLDLLYSEMVMLDFHHHE